MIRPHPTAAAVAAAVTLATACATVPPPSVESRHPASTPGATLGLRSPNESATDAPFASGEAPVPPPSFGASLAIGELDAATTSTILEFASDGAAVIFSSGMAEDAARGAAPDLYRLDPATGAGPELVWRNPRRDHTIVKLGGDLGLLAWVEIPTDGTRAWTFWMLPRNDVEPIALARHPGDADVSSFVPAFDVDESTIAWTAFDRGPNGPVSQLWVARDPRWEPMLVAQRDADRAELWLPSLYGLQLAYCEVRYRQGRTADERRIHLADLGDATAAPRRLDTSGLATMPLSVDGAVYWKEADPGFNMFNWGRMFRHDLATGTTEPIDLGPQEYVNYPSAGSRYLTWWGANAFRFAVHDRVTGESHAIAAHAPATQENVLRPHVAWDLLTWLHVDFDAPEPNGHLRWAFLPPLRDR